jgi:hypothetical protein
MHARQTSNKHDATPLGVTTVTAPLPLLLLLLLVLLLLRPHRAEARLRRIWRMRLSLGCC